MSDATVTAKGQGASWLILPGIVWMALFMVVPIAMICYVSFWTQTTFNISSTPTLASWKQFFSSATYMGALWTTVRIWLIVLATTFIIGYPTALFVGLFVKSKTLSTVLLVICVIPFWTSFLIRVLAWRPMLGKEGAINIILLKLHIISQPIEVLLFTELSVIIGMSQIYCVFMVGPIAFMLGRIDRNIIEAARDLGAGFGRIFWKIIFRDLCQRNGLGRIRHFGRFVRAQGELAGQHHCDTGWFAEMGHGIGHRGNPDSGHGYGNRRLPADRRPEAGAVSDGKPRS